MQNHVEEYLLSFPFSYSKQGGSVRNTLSHLHICFNFLQYHQSIATDSFFDVLPGTERIFGYTYQQLCRHEIANTWQRSLFIMYNPTRSGRYKNISFFAYRYPYNRLTYMIGTNFSYEQVPFYCPYRMPFVSYASRNNLETSWSISG